MEKLLGERFQRARTGQCYADSTCNWQKACKGESGLEQEQYNVRHIKITEQSLTVMHGLLSLAQRMTFY